MRAAKKSRKPPGGGSDKVPGHLKYPRYRKREAARGGAPPAHGQASSAAGGVAAGSVVQSSSSSSSSSVSVSQGTLKTTPSMLIKAFNAANDPSAASAALTRPLPPKIIEFLNIEDYSTQTRCDVAIDEPLFQPYPSEVVFSKFEAFGTYTQRLYFRNNDAFARRIKVLPPDTPDFTVCPVFDDPNLANPKDGKVAAGMEVCYVVTFLPREKRDYEYSLVCVTEREKFVLPVRASGTRACLDFPDQLSLGVSPVKHEATHTFLVRNIGEKPTKFTLSVTEPFGVYPRHGYAGPDSSVQVSVLFTPPEARAYEGELTLEYESGQVAYVQLSGEAENVNVHLSSQILELDPAYISLTSQRTVKIFNRSDIPVKFAWKAFGTPAEESAERNRLHQEINRMEAMERQNLELQTFEDAPESLSPKGSNNASSRLSSESSGADGFDGEFDPEDGDSSDDDNDGSGMPLAKRRELAALSRKYKHLRRAVEEDQLLFADESFRIEPASGEVWANSEFEFTISFSPDSAADYACISFLEVVGRETCLPLKMQATGIGPQAAFSYDVLDIGDVFVNSVHTYNLTLENHGDIVADYALRPSETPFGPKFKFVPDQGSLMVGESHDIEVTFQSEILGEFSEHFHFLLRGTSKPLSAHFKGHVVGPTFHFDVDELDFGVVSYEFLNNKVVSLFNTSEIPMTFALRVPQDGKFLDKEFDISPSTGTIEPDGRIEISVDFISTHVRTYEMYLTVDVESVGEGLLSIPITAECRLPEVTLELEELDYGPCFLRYPYSREVVLKNDSDQRARFEIQPQAEHSTIIGTYATETGRKGTIDAHGKISIPVSLTCEKLGKINLPLMVRISGSEKPALNCALCAQCIGPNVVLDPPQEEGINWGPTPCLTDTTRTLKITNDSLIPAPFRCYFKNPRSVFRVDTNSGMLAPQESIEITLTAHLDDTITHKESLNILVHEGASISFPLVAKGTGTTLFCVENIANIDFGFQFTTNQCERRYLVQNRGRRAQTLQWHNKTKIETDERQRSEWVHQMKEHKLSGAGKKGEDGGKGGGGKKKGKKKAPPEPEPMTPVFSVEPEEVELKPGTACYFSIYGKSADVDRFKETLVCETKLAKEKNFKKSGGLVCDSQGSFIAPKLELSCENMNFVYTWEDGVPTAQSVKELTMKNLNELPLEFVLKTALPFSIGTHEFLLQPGESATVAVTFNPAYRDDRISHVAEGALTWNYRGHPQKDVLPLRGEINFPNVLFDYTTVDFGTVLNDTTKTVSVRATNTTSIDAELQWVFEADEDEAQVHASRKQPFIPINQVYDILPIRSLLRPGESEVIEFAFYAHANRMFKTTAVGVVRGGPEYPIKLQADASTIIHRIDCKFLDFGKVPYDSTDEVKEFYLLNPGQVPYDFRIRMDELSRPDVLEVVPAAGRIYAGDKQKISVAFKPGIPDRLMEQLLIDIAHFEPVVFPVYGHGIFTSCHVSLPRTDNEDESWLTALDEAKRAREGKNAGDADLPPAAMGSDDSRPGTSTTQASVMTTGRGKAKALASAKAAAEAATNLKPPGTAPANITREKAVKAASKEAEEPQAPPKSDELMTITEANRIVFMRHILTKMEEHAEVAAAAMAADFAAELEDGGGEGKTQTTNKGATSVPPLDLGNRGMPSPVALQSARAIEIASKGSLTVRSALAPSFILATYVCDFGNVIAGTTKKRKFSLTNTGHLPVSFTLDTTGAAANGFSVDPPMVKNLPEQESMTFKIVMQSRRQRLGKMRIEIPIFLQDGPASMLVLMANVCIPDISIQPGGQYTDKGEIDFSETICGRQQLKYIQLKNLAPVPTTWSRVIPTTGPKGKDDASYVLEPSQGVLPPYGACNVAVKFSPTAERDYSARISLKCQSNPKLRGVEVIGRGTQLKIRFDPPMLKHDPVLPFDEPMTVLVDAINDTDHDLEFYTLDFDTNYSNEEEVLRSIDTHLWQSRGRQNVMLVQPRLPGEPLPEKVLEDAARQERKAKRREKRAFRAARRAKLTDLRKKSEEDGEEFVEPELEEGQEALPENDDDLASTDEEVGEIEDFDVAQSKREKGLATDIVILGPKMSGVSTHSKQIAEHYRSDNSSAIVVSSIDEIVEWALNKPTQAGEAARSRLGLTPVTEEEEDVDAEEESDAGKPAPLPGRLLVAILRERLGQLDCSDGLIIDGIDTAYSKNPETTATVLKVAFGPTMMVAAASETSETSQDGGDEGSKDDGAATEIEPSLPALLDDSEIDNALAPAMQTVLESKPGKGEPSPQEQVDALLAERKKTEHEAFALSMTLPVTSGAFRLVTLDYSAGDDEYVEHISRLRSSLESVVTALSETIETAKASLSEEEIAQLEAEFVADVFVELTEEEVAALDSVEAKQEYAAQKRQAELKSKIDEKEQSELLLAQMQAAFPCSEKEEGGDEEGDGEGADDKDANLRSAYATAAATIESVVAILDVAAEEAASDDGDAEEPSEEATAAVEEEGGEEKTTGEELGAVATPALEAAAGTASVVLNVEFKAGEDAETCFEVIKEQLPLALEKDEGLPIPEDELTMILSLPSRRRPRNPITNFKIITLGTAKSVVAAEADGGDTMPEFDEDGNIIETAATEGEEAEAVVEEEPFEELAEEDIAAMDEGARVEYEATASAYRAMRGATRWIVPAHSKIPLSIDFQSQATGGYQNVLEFEVVGSDKLFTLPCTATCAVPQMNTDTRNIFMRRAKGKPAQEKVHKKYVLSRSAYEFGPLRINKPKDGFEKVKEDAARAGEAAVAAAAAAASDEAVDEDVEASAAATAGNEKSQAPDGTVQLGAIASQLDNADVLQISNNGLFETTVHLAFRDHDTSKTDEAAGENFPFAIFPDKVTLNPGETKVVSIWAFPMAVGTHEDVLVCSTQNNPEVYQIPLSCIGVMPQIELHGPWEEKNNGEELGEVKEGDEEAKEAGEEPEDTGPIIDFDRLLIKHREAREYSINNTCAIPVAWRLKLSEQLRDKNEFDVGPLNGVLQPGMAAFVTVNFEAIEPNKFEENVTIEFSDIEGGLPPQEGDEGYDPEAPQVEEGESRIQIKEVAVKAEAYDINYVVPQFGSGRPGVKKKEGEAAKSTEEGEAGAEGEDEFEHKDGIMDFGALRVFESASKSFTLNNSGDYDIRFRFVIRRKAIAKLFTVTPMEGMLPAGEDSEGEEVTIKFESSTEVSLRNCKDIRCEIYEPKTDELFESFDLTVGVRSVFSVFRLQPLRGINFGAVKYGQTVSRTIELRNDGEFDFWYKVFDVAAEAERLEAETKTAKEQEDEGVAYKALLDARSTAKRAWDANLVATDAESNEEEAAVIEMGAFNISGASGMVSPGATATMTLEFNAEGSELFRAPIRVDVSGRAPANSTGKSFEIVGESVIPGIETRIFESIFEEQAVVANLQPVGVGEEDGDADHTRISMFAEQQGTFSFGAVVPSQAPKLGIAERFKITNPNKIKAMVSFGVAMRGIDVESESPAFQVQPASLELPPHEHRYVTVYFKPVEMRTYSAKFEAKVADGTDTRTNNLTFELTGEGTLPCVTVEQPTQLTEQGSLLVDFPRTRVGKSTTRPIVLRNGGTVPVSVYFSMEVHDVFSFNGRGRTITLAPKASERLQVEFSPNSATPEDGSPWEGELQINTAQNEYGTTRITLRGLSYADDIAFENLPGGHSDEIDFGELSIVPQGLEGYNKVVSFNLENHCADSAIRFEMPKHEDFIFRPAVGHLKPRATIDVIATFRPSAFDIEEDEDGTDASSLEEDSEESARSGEQKMTAQDKAALEWDDAVEHAAIETLVKMTRIKYPYELVEEKSSEDIELMSTEEREKYETSLVPAPAWNSEMKSIDYEIDDETGDQKKVVSVNEEPAHEPTGDPQEVVLKLTAKADKVHYYTGTDTLQFRPTMMFQTRVHRFEVKNNSRVAFTYDWSLLNDTGSSSRPDTTSAVRASSRTSAAAPTEPDCPFEILPQQGSIAAGASSNFTVRYSPLEVPLARDATFRYTAHANVYKLAPGEAPLKVTLVAPAQRPVCHFAVEATDYLERRPTDLPGPSGNLGMLDPSIKVIFFESLGTSIKNTQRFKVINPTNMSYEFAWEPIGVVHPAFNCAIMSGLVLPGKRHEMIFEYTPSSNDVHGFQESFWRFTIPAQGIDQLFLVAGTVTDPRVSMDHTFVNFGQVLLGNEGKEIVNLVNLEKIPFGFSFDKAALRGDGGKPQLSITPMSGTIPAEGKFPLTIKFSPSDEKLQNINVSCNIRRKPHNLSLNLKGEGAGVHDTLTLVDSQDDSEGETKNAGMQGVTLSTEGVNFVDFGNVHINDIARKRIFIKNTGKFNTDFKFTRSSNPQVKIEPRQGTVRIGERLACDLTFHPINVTPIQNLKLDVTVAGAHTYSMSISGVGAKPMLDFSFISHDFGPCFVPERGAAPMQEQAILRITNNEFNKDVSFDCLFQKLPFLEVKAEPTVLKPNESVDVPIIFTPREVKTYLEQVPFELNGLYTVNVSVAGEVRNHLLNM